MHGDEFWRGYVAALDDAQAAYLRDAADVNRPMTGEWFADVRRQFALRAFTEDGPAAHAVVARSGEIPDMDGYVRRTLRADGVPDTAIDELLVLARRAGREANEATRPSPGAHPHDSEGVPRGGLGGHLHDDSEEPR